MMTSMRTIIDLPGAQLEALDALCRREGISRAEAIRRAVALQLRQTPVGDPARAFGLWRDRRVDGLVYERPLRDEWTRPSPPRRRKAR
jgi:hypothetical protein